MNGTLEHLVARQRIANATVVTLDVTNAHLGHLAIAFFHLTDDPLQGNDRLFRVRHNRRQKVRNAVIDRQFEHLRVDHDQTAFIWRQLVKQRQDHRVDRNRFTRTRRTRDQQVRHLREVRHDRLTTNVLAQRQRQTMIAIAIITARQDFAEAHHLALIVGKFDTNDRTTGNRRYTCGQGRHRTRDVVGQTDYTARLQTRRRFKLVHRDNRTGPNRYDFAFDTVVIQNRLEHPCIFFERFVGQNVTFNIRWVHQQVQRWRLIVHPFVFER